VTCLDVDLVVFRLRSDQMRQVSVQQLKNDVDGVELRPLRWEQDVADGDDVRVLQEAEEAQLPDDADGVCLISQHAVDVLDRHLLLGLAVLRGAARG
jgi:hypothetical protein